MRGTSIKAVAALVVWLVLLGCWRQDRLANVPVGVAEPGGGRLIEPSVTFCQHIAPLVYQHCTPCHREGGSAPFALQTYDEVSKRAQQIGEVVTSRYMPPWLPAPGDYQFVGNRRLPDAAIARFNSWIKDGLLEGDHELLPPAPVFDSAWLLGEPDLVIEMPEPFLHRASDVDEWRNFVLPLPLSKTKFVRTYDVRAENPRAIHHAVIQLDQTGRSRQLAAADALPGFAGMQNGQITLGGSNPDQQLLGWLPGKLPNPGSEDIAWRIDPGDDVVLQLHMPATGKDELVRVRIGLYFAAKPPTTATYAMVLSERDIDIPPGEANYVRELSYTLPIDTALLGVFPHAHYLCEEMLVTAESPTGDRTTLIHIPQWDFDWQDDYQFARRVELAKGTRISMRYRYNNSVTNEQNPFDPPRRIQYGEQSTDSMGDLILHLVTRSVEDRATLTRDFQRFQFRQSLARRGNAIQQNPADARNHVLAGEASLLLGESEQAISFFQRARELGDQDARTDVKLAMALWQNGQLDAAMAAQRRALQRAPRNLAWRHQLAQMLLSQARTSEAAQEYEQILKHAPQDVRANTNLGMLLGQQGQFDRAEALLRTAVRQNPDFVPARINLGITLRSLRRFDEAIHQLQRAVELAPENANARANLQRTTEMAGFAQP